MTLFRIALANVRPATHPDESVAIVLAAITQAAAQKARIVCFPECLVPGYRALGKVVPPPDAAFLESAWTVIAEVAKANAIAVILGTERFERGAILATALVIDADGTRLGFQDKVQIDPTEDGIYAQGSERRVFHVGPLTFGIVICHEGWRYPETVRFAVRRGAQVVFHPHFHEPMPGAYRPATFADPANTFHEKAMFCRAAENTCFFASVNTATVGSPTTSAIARPDGSLLCYQPYGVEGVLVADLDLAEATRLLAERCRTGESSSWLA